jgi:serine/threonine protein kinase
VYEAIDRRLGRRVALKFIASTQSNRRAEGDELLREANWAARLAHPNVCAVYDVDEHEGRMCLVLEYLRGLDLKRYMTLGALKSEEIIDFGIQIAEGLDAAHRAGVVHNDIKPANLFLTETGLIKLLDFGSATSCSGGLADSPRAGRVIGTADYIAPERIGGFAGTPPSDLFSLGAVLYEMTTGQKPFDGRSTAETLFNVLDKDPLPIGHVGGRPDALGRIVMKLLAKKAASRYRSAADARQALHRLRSIQTPGVRDVTEDAVI